MYYAPVIYYQPWMFCLSELGSWAQVAQVTVKEPFYSNFGWAYYYHKNFVKETHQPVFARFFNLDESVQPDSKNEFLVASGFFYCLLFTTFYYSVLLSNVWLTRVVIFWVFLRDPNDSNDQV